MISGNESIEIVIGGGSNTFSQIRLLRNEYKKTILTQKTENILSEINYRKFLISVDNLGIVFVKDENDVFLSWRFDNLFPIKYYAFGSWTNTKADWKFGCDKNTGTYRTYIVFVISVVFLHVKSAILFLFLQ